VHHIGGSRARSGKKFNEDRKKNLMTKVGSTSAGSASASTGKEDSFIRFVTEKMGGKSKVQTPQLC